MCWTARPGGGCRVSMPALSAGKSCLQVFVRRTALPAGNAGCTLITKSFARQLGLIDMHGNPTQAYSQTIRVQGVVAGAVEMIKTLNITYEIKGVSTAAMCQFAKFLAVLKSGQRAGHTAL